MKTNPNDTKWCVWFPVLQNYSSDWKQKQREKNHIVQATNLHPIGCLSDAWLTSVVTGYGQPMWDCAWGMMGWRHKNEKPPIEHATTSIWSNVGLNKGYYVVGSRGCFGPTQLLAAASFVLPLCHAFYGSCLCLCFFLKLLSSIFWVDSFLQVPSYFFSFELFLWVRPPSCLKGPRCQVQSAGFSLKSPWQLCMQLRQWPTPIWIPQPSLHCFEISKWGPASWYRDAIWPLCAAEGHFWYCP